MLKYNVILSADPKQRWTPALVTCVAAASPHSAAVEAMRQTGRIPTDKPLHAFVADTAGPTHSNDMPICIHAIEFIRVTTEAG